MYAEVCTLDLYLHSLNIFGLATKILKFTSYKIEKKINIPFGNENKSPKATT